MFVVSDNIFLYIIVAFILNIETTFNLLNDKPHSVHVCV